MATIIENLDIKLGYKESMTLTRDEWSELREYADDFERDELHEGCRKEIEESAGYKKQLDMAVDLLEGITECIDDEGVVTPDDQRLLAQRIKLALKFISNIQS